MSQSRSSGGPFRAVVYACGASQDLTSPVSTLEGVLHEEVLFPHSLCLYRNLLRPRGGCFRLTIDWMHLALLGPLPQTHSWRLFAVPSLAGLVVAALVMRVFPGIRGSGVNQTKSALYIFKRIHPVSHRRRKIHLRRHRHRFRSIARARRTFSPNRRQHRLRSRPPTRNLPRKTPLDGPGRRRRWPGGRLQRSHLCRLFVIEKSSDAGAPGISWFRRTLGRCQCRSRALVPRQ